MNKYKAPPERIKHNKKAKATDRGKKKRKEKPQKKQMPPMIQYNR